MSEPTLRRCDHGLPKFMCDICKPAGSLAAPDGSAFRVDVEIIVRPIPYSGVGRHFGGPCDAKGIRDNAAIARALRKVADELDAQNEKLTEAGRKPHE